jgi:basic membrane protein A
MRRYVKLVSLAMVFMMVLLVSACSPSATSTPVAKPTAKPLKVALLIPGTKTDQSWPQFGYEGLVRARDKCGVEIAVSEQVTQDAHLELYRSYASQGYNIIAGGGGEYGPTMAEVADEFPDIQWLPFNSATANGKNMTAYRHSYGNAAYLAGVLAAHMTKTNKVGIVVGEPILVAQTSYEQLTAGAQVLGKKVEVIMVNNGSWSDVGKAYEASAALIASGVDVLYPFLDTADVGVHSAAEDKGVYAIGIYTDKEPNFPKSTIGSVIMSPADMVEYVICNPEARDGKVHAQTAGLPGGPYLKLTGLVPADVQKSIFAFEKKVQTGEIKVPE